jgi:DNA sulfur modification protein DndC
MSLRKISGSHLSRHSTLPKAFVYTPIEPFTVGDVWTYLLQVPSPWGGNNRDLVIRDNHSISTISQFLLQN